MSRRNLRILMGSKAFEHVKANGLRPEDIGTVSGAAGGLKALVLHGLDQFIFERWLKGTRFEWEGVSQKRLLVGASVGSWRMAAVCTDNPGKHLATFPKHYLMGVDFNAKWTPREVATCRG